MLKLIIEDDENQVKVVRLLRDEITIGRKEGNTIRLTERNVSRKHARLIKKNDDIVLEDMGSYNGVKVNGVRISEPVEIDEGDKILIGDYTLMLKVEEKSEVDPFEEMATIPVERLSEETLQANAPGVIPPKEKPVSEDSPTVQVPVKGLQQEAKPPAPAPAAVQQPPAQAPAPSPAAEQIPSDQRGKLVVTTSNYAGTTFELAHNSMVIGRNRENDIFIDHASLSAIHAKVTYDGSTYSIEDMGSKNGMLINNDEYDKMALRKGDVIQLGHVRFRFVAPGEMYSFASEAESLDFGQHSNKKIILIALALVVTAGLIFIFAFSGIFGKKGSSGSDADGASVDVTEVVKQIDTYKSLKEWDNAIKLAKTTLGKKGISGDQKAKITTVLSQMRDEKNHKSIIAQVDPLLKKAKWAEAAAKALTIPKSSVYFNEAQAKISTAKQSFKTDAITKSKLALKEKKCATINDYITKAASFNFTSKELSELTALYSSCSTTDNKVVTNNGNNNASSQNNSSSMSHHTMRKTMTKDPPDMTPPAMKDEMSAPTMNTTIMSLPMETPMNSSSGGTDYLAKGKEAYKSGNCSKAVRYLKKAYAKTGSGQALKYIGLCGCKSRRKSWASWAYAKMGGGQKKLIKKLCKKKGLNL